MPPEDEKPEGAEGTKGDELATARAELDAAKAALAAKDVEIARTDKVARDAREYIAALMARSAAEPGPPAEGGKSFEDKLSENPEAAIDELFQTRVGPVYNEYLMNQAKISREVAASKLNEREVGDRWTDYEGEIDEFMAKMPPDVKARPDAYESAFNLVRSRHVDKIVEERIKHKLDIEKRSQTEHASPPASKREAPVTLSPDEKRVAELLGVSEKDYLQSKIEHAESGGHWSGSAGA